MLKIALKEWDVIVELLSRGAFALLLRKGGIHEDEGPGEFRLEHPRFVLFPSYLHQKPAMMKPTWRDRAQPLKEPAEVTLRAIGEAVKIWHVPSRAAFDQLDDLHPWAAPYVDLRFNYKPDHPLYLVAVRVYRLAEPKTVINNWTYGGCKSWIPLTDNDAIDPTGATPAMSDADLQAVIDRVRQAFAT